MPINTEQGPVETSAFTNVAIPATTYTGAPTTDLPIFSSAEKASVMWIFLLSLL
jgi:hypothetical protein